MKKLLTLLLCVSLAFILAVPAFAYCGKEGIRTANDSYVKSLYAIGYNGGASLGYVIADLGLPSAYNNRVVGGSPSGDNDLNKGCGSGSQYVRLIYSEFTSNANEAITDLIAVYKDKGVECDGYITVGDVTYKPVSGKSEKYYGFGNDDYKFYDVFDFNDNYDDSDCHKAVYLYYTTDSRAGDPITKLNIYYDSQNRNKDNLVKELASNDVCDFNEGYKNSNAVYLQMERGGSSAGSIFNDTTSVVFICVGVVVILAVIGFVIFKKRKGAEQ